MATAEQRAFYTKTDADFAAELEKAGPRPIYTDREAAKVREMLKKATQGSSDTLAARFGDEDFSNVTSSDITLPGRNGLEIPTRLYQPKTPPAQGSPLVMMLHGGGFVLGDAEGEDLKCRLFVKEFGAVCFNVLYRLAPEFPFPAAVEDSWVALNYFAAQAKAYGARPSLGFFVGGTWAGGNLTDVVVSTERSLSCLGTVRGWLSHAYREGRYDGRQTALTFESGASRTRREARPAIDRPARAHVSTLTPSKPPPNQFSPSICPPKVIPEKYKEYYTSHKDAADAPVLPQSVVDWFHNNYKPDYHSHLYSPFNWPGGHTGLPPITFQICGADMLRDGALIYEKVLREELGMKTKLTMYPGLPHGFWSFFPQMEKSRLFILDVVENLRWLLEQKGKQA